MARKGPLWSSFSIHNVLFTGLDPWERDLDDATFFRAATTLGPDKRRWDMRPKDTLRGPLWRVWLARMLFIWPPPIWLLYGAYLNVTHRAGLWALLLPVFWWWLLLAAAAVFFGRKLWGWWTNRFNYHQVVEPTARAVAESLGYRFSRSKAGQVVKVPGDFDLEPQDLPEDADDAADVPEEYDPVRINLPVGKAWTPQLQKRLVDAVGHTLNMPHAEAKWALHGSEPYVLISRAVMPPQLVSFEDARHFIEKADFEHPVMGMAAGSKVVQADFLESPHELISAATTSGKSALIGGELCQRMHHGAGLLILDYKRISHKWAHNLKGCVYAWKIDDIHRYAVAMGEILDRRINSDLDENGDFPEFPIFDVLLEEANTTKKKLTQWWMDNRDTRNDPMESPAVQALDNLSNMGRELGIHLIYAAQRASAGVFGGRGGDMRENFVHRYLSKWTRQTWTMLAGGTPFQRWPGGGRGIWLKIELEKTTLFRGVLWTKQEMRKWASSGRECADIEQDLQRVIEAQEAIPELVTVAAAGRPERVTLTEAVNFLPGLTLDNARTLADPGKNRDKDMPKAVGRRGNGPKAAREWLLVDLDRWWGLRTGGGGELVNDPLVAGLVYAIYTRRTDQPGVELAYIGQTTQQPWTKRLDGHERDQPWWDLYVGAHVLWPENGQPIRLRQSQLDQAEIAKTHELLPRYPYEGQEGAPHATPKWEAKEQRWARDDAAGRPRWEDPRERDVSHLQLVQA